MAKRSGPKLKDYHRAFLVRRLACYGSPKQAVDALKEEYGVEVTPQAAECYTPGKVAARNISRKWVELFDFTRKAFLTHIEDHIPGANKAVRMARFERAAAYFEQQKNYIAMADMTERQAKEMGNVHTNRREFTGKDRGPIKVQAIDDMTDQQIDDEFDRLMAKARGEEPKPTKH